MVGRSFRDAELGVTLPALGPRRRRAGTPAAHERALSAHGRAVGIAATSARMATCAAREPICALATDKPAARVADQRRDRATDHAAERCALVCPRAGIDPDLRLSTARRERTDRAGRLQERES